jgi:hypothetical protein
MATYTATYVADFMVATITVDNCATADEAYVRAHEILADYTNENADHFHLDELIEHV